MVRTYISILIQNEQHYNVNVYWPELIFVLLHF